MIKADVAVIGGGPGGLAAAHAIHKACPALKVAVFERTRSITRRGAGLGLDINGQKALKGIEPALHSQVLAMASFLKTNRVMQPDGTILQDVPIVSQTRKEYAEQGYITPCLLGWSDLQQLLYKELPDQSSVHLGAEFDHYDEDPSTGTVTVHFRGDQPPVQANLLVASDGYFSRVRRQCVADGPPTFGKTVVWRARLPAAAAMAVGFNTEGCSTYIQEIGRMLFSYPISSGDYVWTFAISEEKMADCGIDAASVLQHLRKDNATKQASDSATAAADYTSQETQGYSQQETAKGEAAKQRCLQAMQGFSEPVLRMIADTPAGSVVEHGVYVRNPATMSPDAYGKGRVVIIGDAAHPMRPTGQGLNMAMEDCWGLGRTLLGVSSGAAIQLPALQAFRQQQAARLQPIMAFTQASGESSYKAKWEDRSDEERASMQADTPVMSVAEFVEYAYTKQFDNLGELLEKEAGTGVGAWTG